MVFYYLIAPFGKFAVSVLLRRFKILLFGKQSVKNSARNKDYPKNMYLLLFIYLFILY